MVDLALRTLRGEIRPVMAAFDCRMIDVFPTSREPMRGFVDRLSAMQGRDGVLSLSLIHGFMAADVPEMGTQMLAIADGDAAKAAGAGASSLGLEVFALRGQTAMPMLGIEAGLDAALALAARKTGRPAVVADVWDNPGGGVAGDGTLILRRMLERGIGNFALATIWDPIAVDFLPRGGRRGAAATALRRQGGTRRRRADRRDGRRRQGDAENPGRVSAQAASRSAPTALVRIAGTDVELILNTNRTQTFEPNIFSNLGVDPTSERHSVVKSTNHFYAGFAPIAEGIVYIDAGAPYPSHPRGDPISQALARNLAEGRRSPSRMTHLTGGPGRPRVGGDFGASALARARASNHIARRSARRRSDPAGCRAGI